MNTNQNRNSIQKSTSTSTTSQNILNKSSGKSNTSNPIMFKVMSPGLVARLAKINKTYIIFTVIVLLIIVVLASLFLFNPSGFTSVLGPSIFLTLLSGVIMIILAKNYINIKHLGSNYEIGYLAGSMIIALGLIAAIASSLGLFKSGASATNTGVIINFAVLIFIITIIALTSIIGFAPSSKDSKNLKITAGLKSLIEGRLKYTILFGLYCLGMILLYTFNPMNIVTRWSGAIVFISMFIGILLLFTLLAYNYDISSSIYNLSSLTSDNKKVWGVFTTGIFILLGALLAGGAIYGCVKLLTMVTSFLSPSNGGFMEWIARAVIIGASIYALINAYKQYTNSSQTYSGSNMKIMGLVIMAISGFIYTSKVMIPRIKSFYHNSKGGGTVLVDNPISLDTESTVSSFHLLNPETPDKLTYAYAISCWVYFDSFPPNTSSAYRRRTNILSYGKLPYIQYEGENRTLFIGVKRNAELNEEQNKEGQNKEESNLPQNRQYLDHDLFVKKDVLLQKWNHIVVNYSNGTIDIFYNGELVQSANEVVPYMTFDSFIVGEANGVKGNIDDVVYYDKALNISEIEKIRERK